jgi:ABC-type Fe3+-siderophore transport system permease subunit
MNHTMHSNHEATQQSHYPLTRRSRSRRAAGTHSLAALMIAGCLVAGLALAPLAASASSGSSIAKEAGLGAASGLATIVYMPVKLAYAIGGTIVGGLAYVFSGGDSEVAKVVLTPATAGDYVITPSILRAEQELEVFGRDPALRDDPIAPSSVASAPEAW